MSASTKLIQSSGALSDSYWITTFAGNGFTDSGESISFDSSGNVYGVGISESDSAGSDDGLVIKMDTDANVLWSKTVGGTDQDEFQRSVVDSSDNIIACGYNASFDAGGLDATLVKLDSDGSEVWAKRLGGSLNETFGDVKIDSSGDIVAIGWVESDGAGNDDLFIAKYNSSGVLQWDRTLGGAALDRCYAVDIDASDNIIVVGETRSYGAGNINGIIAKYNSSGTIQWQKVIGVNQSPGPTTQVFGVYCSASGDIFVTGRTNASGVVGTYDLFFAKYNSSGVRQFIRFYGISGVISSASRIVSDSPGVFYVMGGAGGMLIAEFNADGDIQWANTLSTAGSDSIQGISISPLGSPSIAFSTTTGRAAGFAKLPADGSGQGTYGNFTYATVTFSENTTTSLLDVSASLTDAAAVLTDGTITGFTISDTTTVAQTLESL